MSIPTIYASNVAVLFGVFLVSFGIFWGITKALKIVLKG